ncbi:RHS repeat domain-containing protein [Terrihalobacillus insolitus]|uniref:RHS repeat domain-containing protein n=1 Tax=Terrihalobacillus insolitus TaxID=2950438 RepID=UPI002342424A|nr:RHS repeat-associated core domain-containing protein [Terrihalobacillus insolitus]MDC3414928.1 type IV secretion protein Rhs [Terrihalobacillus insolitus]
MESIKIFDTAGYLLDEFMYSYDKNNNITQIESQEGTVTYQYDELNQLIQETLIDGTILTYEYDSVGNRTQKTTEDPSGGISAITYSYNEANELTNVGSQAYSYDANGNLISTGDKTFIYNANNRLVEVQDADGVTIASFSYDEQGRRIRKTTSDGTTYYHYDLDSINVIYETDQDNSVFAEFTYDEQNRPATMIKDETIYYYHFNAHGDVIGLTDENGSFVAEYQYDAWGNIIIQSGSMASKNPYRYANYRYDEETKLYYLITRYYDAYIGRFLTKDKFQGINTEPLSLNRYIYVRNNPVMYIDPSGRIAWWIWAAAIDIGKGLFFYAYDIYRGNQSFSWGSLSWTITTSAVNGILGKYMGLRKVYSIAYGVYLDVKWTVFSWTWDPPENKWEAARRLGTTITRSIAGGLK